MEPGRPEVGTVIGERDLVAQALELRAANIGQYLPVRPLRGLRVQENRQIEAVGNSLAECARELYAVFHRRLAQGHERDDINRADARMLALVRVEVDALDGNRNCGL